MMTSVLGKYLSGQNLSSMSYVRMIYVHRIVQTEMD